MDENCSCETQSEGRVKFRQVIARWDGMTEMPVVRMVFGVR